MQRLFGILGGVAAPIHRWAPGWFRANGLPTLILTTIGAHTGRRRRALLGYLVDGEGWLVVASMGGAGVHPAWY